MGSYDAMDMGYMSIAIIEAGHAAFRGERPFGACVIDPAGNVIGTGGGSETPLDPTRHSELEAIRMACGTRDRKLEGCTIYSTHEPCLMCTGGILHAHLSRVVFGSCREDLSMLFRAYDSQAERRWGWSSHPPEVVGGCLRHRCIKLFEQEVLDATRTA